MSLIAVRGVRQIVHNNELLVCAQGWLSCRNRGLLPCPSRCTCTHMELLAAVRNHILCKAGFKPVH